MLTGRSSRNHFVGQQLRLLRLCRREPVGLKIDRAAFLAHVKTDRGHVEKLNERGGEHMLSGVLLHMVAAARGIDCAVYLRPYSQWRGRKVQNASIFLVGNFGDGDLLAIGLQHSEIVDLAAACRIKSRAVEHDGCLPSLSNASTTRASKS